MLGKRIIGGRRHQIVNSLRMRVLVLVLLGFAAVTAPAYVAFNWMVGAAIQQLATLFAEKQILYDRHRGLEALMSEVILAETLAGSQSIRDWANNETDPVLKRRGVADLEHFRRFFSDKSYFFAMGKSGNYYFNDAGNSYAGNQYRYTLDQENPRDAWYFATAKLGDGCHLNVDNDANLRVTKIWMNCIIREGRRVLGILGTGIDLTAFIQEVVNIPQPGITSIFVDRQGAVQAHRDQNLVDLTSLSVEMRAKRTVFSLLDVPADRTHLRALMDEVATGKSLVTSSFMQIGGKQMLVGIGYLDELGWFNVTLMDIGTIIDKRLFVPIGALLALVMGLVAVVMVMVFNRQVLDRLKQLEGAVRSALKGDYKPVRSMKDPRLDEIGRLTSAFSAMAATVSDNINQLETRVLQRTKELQQLAFRDAQTGIPNRRGFIDAFSNAAPHQRRGLLLLDIDNFKTINDNFGHAGGDAVILAIADRLSGAIGQDNICGRWGGDEFIVLLSHTAPHVLQAAAYSVMAAITNRPVDLPNGRSCQVTVSVGACIVEPGDSIDVATDMADTGLYAAKNEGRNRITLFQPATSEETKRSNFEARGREARSSERQR